MKITTEDFIKKARQIHGDKYNYSKVNYTKAKIKVVITCPIHGDFEQTPDAHLRGSGCPKCSGKLINDTESFVTYANKIHNFKYDYSKVNYTTAKVKVCIICPQHGEFWQTPDAHVRLQRGCPECKKEKLHNDRRKDFKQFIKEANIVHNNKYSYDKFNYVNNKIKGIIICPKHGQFEQSPDNHLRGKGCPHCNDSHGERLIYTFLTNNGFIFKTQVRNIVNSQLLILDFVVKINNDYQVIEYNGRQHYVPVEHFGGQIQFEKQQARDQLLRNRCKEKNIKLHEIPYTWSDSEVIQYLTDNLK